VSEGMIEEDDDDIVTLVENLVWRTKEKRMLVERLMRGSCEIPRKYQLAR